MIRNHKKQLIAASALILLPILVGLLLMDRLPEETRRKLEKMRRGEE